MEKARHYIKEIISCVLTFGLVYVLKDAGMTKYVVLLGASAALFLYGFKSLKKEFLILGLPAVVYVVMGVILSLILRNLSYQSVKETAFAIIPLIAAISFFVASQKANIDFIKWIYWAMVALTLACLRYYYIEDVTETQYAFIFGVFLLYFCIIKKNLKYILFTAFMLYLMNKRIAMIAALLTLIMYDLLLRVLKLKPEWKKKIPQYLSLAAIFLFCGYVIFLCAANLEGQFLQDLTSGRSSAWAVVKEHYHLSILWLGRGLGDVVNLLGELQFPNFTTNLHNDLLKVFAEIGTLGYTSWLVSHFVMCYWISKKKNLGFKRTVFLYLVIIYTLLNYTTDNIMVYVNYWFPAYLLILTVAFSHEKYDIVEEDDDKREHRLLLGVIFVFGICILGNVVYVYKDYKDPSSFTIPHEAVEVYSPDGGTTRATVWLRDGQPYYRVRYGGEDLIEPSILGVSSSEYAIEKNVVFEETDYQEIVDEKTALAEKDNPIKAAYQPVFIKMQKDDTEILMELRVYDYGVAFRYLLPYGVKNLDDLTQIRFLQGSSLDIYDENTDNKKNGLSTENLEEAVYRFPFSVQYASGSIMKISEMYEEDSLSSFTTKAKGKERTLDIEFYFEVNLEGNDQIKTPWRVFEIER